MWSVWKLSVSLLPVLQRGWNLFICIKHSYLYSHHFHQIFVIKFFLEFTVFTKYWGFGLKLFSPVYKALISQNSQEMGIFNFNYFSPNLSAKVIAVLLIFLIFLKYILISFNLKFLKFMYYSLNMIKTLYFWEKYYIVIKSI